MGEFDFTALSANGRYFLPRWVKKGAQVLIVAGPFRSCAGVIERTVNRRSLELSVPFLARLSTMEVPLSLIERVRGSRSMGCSRRFKNH